MPAVGITDGPPPCARDQQTVVLACSHLDRVALERRSVWLVVDTQVVPEKPTVLPGHLKHTDTMPFK